MSDNNTNPFSALPHSDLIRAVLDGKMVRRRHDDGNFTYFATDAEGQHAAISAILDYPDWCWEVKRSNIVRWIPIFYNELGDGKLIEDVVTNYLSVGTRVDYDPKARTKEEATAALNSHDKQVLFLRGAGAWLRLEFDSDTRELVPMGCRTEPILPESGRSPGFGEEKEAQLLRDRQDLQERNHRQFMERAGFHKD